MERQVSNIFISIRNQQKEQAPVE